MSQTPGSREYIERVRAVAIERGCQGNHPDVHTLRTTKPSVSWLNGLVPLETDDIEKVFEEAQRARNAVCIVEDISWDWIGAMGVTWGIEPHFFADYGVSPGGDKPWESLLPNSRRSRVMRCASRYHHVDGVFDHQHLAGHPEAFTMLKNVLQRSEHRRQCWISTGSSPLPLSSTRISYCRVNAKLCMDTHLLLWPSTDPCLVLFLVDPPLFPTALDVLNSKETDLTASMQHLRSKTRLRVQCPGSHGILLPQLLKRRVYSLRQALHNVFRHAWQLDIMFDRRFAGDEAIDRGELLHLISASLHRSNLFAIDHEIKTISFNELRDPDMRTNAKLLTLREVLSKLDAETAKTSKYAPIHVKEFYEAIYGMAHRLDRSEIDELDFHSPIARLEILNQQAGDLQRFLMDSFQLLMSSVSVAETQNAARQATMSMEQAARTARLTQLAFVYIPLTFVTSIFGMNVKELSDPLLPLWVCVVTLVVVSAATAAIFGSYKYKPVNLLGALFRQRELGTRGPRWNAVTSQGTDAVATDEEKGPTRSGLAQG
jgi:hypothetical protein